MTATERVEAFKVRFQQQPASWPYVVQEQGRDVIYGTWMIGAAYANESDYYGAFPRSFMQRVMGLFPDIAEEQRFANSQAGGVVRSMGWMGWPVLHAFSGSLGPGPHVRLDSNHANTPELVGDVLDAERLCQGRRFPLIVADPPYTVVDAKKYDTPMINRGKVTDALAKVATPGGHLVWLDTVWPMHNKLRWVTSGRITLVRSTNHRVRMVTIFQRVG